MERLAGMGRVYPCVCTRADLMASRAPHASDGHVAYPGRCRPSVPCYDAVNTEANLRLMVTPCPGGPACDVVSFDDLICGPQNVALSGYFGDFVLRRKGGDWAYQFAVAVDDADMGVTDVVRGDDLLMSTAPQIYVMSLLGLSRPAMYAHLPLLKNSDGVRLSKRDGAMSMEWLRANCSPCDVIAAVCNAAGLNPDEMLSMLERLR